MDEEKIKEENLNNEDIPEETAEETVEETSERPVEEPAEGSVEEYAEGSAAEQQISTPEPEKPAVKPKEELYIYEADDEPVDDRDLYRDYPGNVSVSAVRNTAGSASEPSVQPSLQAALQSGVSDSVQSVQPRQINTLNAREYNVPIRAGTGHSDNMSKKPEKERQTSGRSNISVINTVISMITLCVAAGGIFTGLAYMRSHDQQVREDQKRMDHLEQQVAAMSAEKDGGYVDAVSLIDEEEKNEPAVPADEAVDVERGKIITYDSYVGYSWVPVLSGVKTNTYDKNAFVVDDENRLSYKPGGEVSSYFGVDVSAHQGDIDWNAARADGVEFAILRIGVRGYAKEGNIRLDDKFYQNYDGARDAGIDIGVYFYSQAISVDEAIEEANFVLEKLGGRKLEYPVAFDWEPVDAPVDDTPPRTEDVMPGTLNLAARAFCETIEDAGYKAMIYTNKKMAYLKYDLRLFEGYPVWVALYNTDMTYFYDFDIWQYGAGKVAGIDGDVDVNIAIIR